jgi:hypothetical protein
MRTNRTWIQALRWGSAVFLYLLAVLAFRSAVFNFSPDAREWNSITGYGGAPAPSGERGWYFLLLTVACIITANVLLWFLRMNKVVWPRRLAKSLHSTPR